MLKKTQQQARLDCLIFFQLCQHGWRVNSKQIKEDKAKRVSALQSDQRLNYPSYERIFLASKRVNQTCPDLSRRYKAQVRKIREVTKRYDATQDEESWFNYKRRLNYNWLIAKFRRVTKEEFISRYHYAYLPKELLDRKLEQERALQEFQQASATIETLEDHIFAEMGVPFQYRSMNVDEQRIREEISNRNTSGDTKGGSRTKKS